MEYAQELVAANLRLETALFVLAGAVLAWIGARLLLVFLLLGTAYEIGAPYLAMPPISSFPVELVLPMAALFCFAGLIEVLLGREITGQMIGSILTSAVIALAVAPAKLARSAFRVLAR